MYIIATTGAMLSSGQKRSKEKCGLSCRAKLSGNCTEERAYSEPTVTGVLGASFRLT